MGQASEGPVPCKNSLFKVRSQVFSVYVSLVMLRQMVAPHEALLTLVALEAFVSCVCPCVPLELVAACESFPTENPVADEGPLSGVQPDVSSEQRRLPERLLTTGNVADVLPLPHLPRPLVCIFTVGAGAGHAPLLLSGLRRQL